jgi:preprotein translocase subunit Sec63
MGLSNSAPVFERLMEQILTGLTWKICLVYLDDIIIFSNSFEKHMQNLREVCQRLKEANLKLSSKKCNFLKKEVKILGQIVCESGASTDPSKIQEVRVWPIPKNIKEVRSFLGLTSYYRKFILKYADKALHKITEKNKNTNLSGQKTVSNRLRS